ncbi:methionine ABC transporter ATP-binding protein [Ureibacillus sinduriensis]|uniref:Phosphate ABC transporter ATP-binding protein n=1 Tax=Ureibacillus sinduriensis BLB-1 = JCM 15800 TaxID=1384057 RepID=A0A0A3HR63_9BACL|nr:methionine ABC transporter ATP-binding protein [Ureibacillus sinduriensis]KGR75101.1 phosphate ABC transporter ATP-binding protein [Ureibacillus sinduriensis BLB-1 = JCM 15800]
MIKLENVSKTFEYKGKKVAAVKDVSLHINKGDIFGIIGFSGAGKSTLVRLVNLLEKPTSGEITVNDHPLNSISSRQLRQLRRKIGMIFQSFNLFNSRTVFGNVAYPLKLENWPKEEINRRVTELLRFVGLEDKADKYPEQLSGGQKQRVGIARALATSPDILLCDEATSALDPETTGEILNLLKKVNEEYKITILLITHEMNVIRSICNRVAVMENGRVIEEGEVYNVFSDPRENTTKNFISTVLNDRLSPHLIEKLKKKQPTKFYRIIFSGEATSEPILSEITSKHNIKFNIIYGSIHELQNQLFGNLIVEFLGDDPVVEVVLNELRMVLDVKEVELA